MSCRNCEYNRSYENGRRYENSVDTESDYTNVFNNAMDDESRRYAANNDPRRGCNNNNNNMQRPHVHEYAGSVKLAEECDDRHNHRVAGVTGEVIPINNGTNHVHKINDNTDYYDHNHKICGTTGPAISIPGTNKHIHLVYGATTKVDCHIHRFVFTTQVQAPLL